MEANMKDKRQKTNKEDGAAEGRRIWKIKIEVKMEDEEERQRWKTKMKM